MINSMTAFAREALSTEAGVLTVELRSVNHRYLDCSFKLPDSLRLLEPKLRELIGKSVTRGKLDCLVRIQHHIQDSTDVQVDKSRLAQVVEAASTIAESLPQAQAINPLDLLQFPGICATQVVSEEAVQHDALNVFKTALKDLNDNRSREGEKMAQLIRSRLVQVTETVGIARERLPLLLQQQRERTTARLAELNIEMDRDRLDQELVYLAQKADVDEELDRLDAHVTEVARTLDKGSPCGRRLDFLMQELNREANTLSSKSLSSDATQDAVHLKVLIEQMREQIQNIE